MPEINHLLNHNPAAVISRHGYRLELTINGATKQDITDALRGLACDFQNGDNAEVSVSAGEFSSRVYNYTEPGDPHPAEVGTILAEPGACEGILIGHHGERIDVCQKTPFYPDTIKHPLERP